MSLRRASKSNYVRSLDTFSRKQLFASTSTFHWKSSTSFSNQLFLHFEVTIFTKYHLLLSFAVSLVSQTEALAVNIYKSTKLYLNVHFKSSTSVYKNQNLPNVVKMQVPVDSFQ